MIEQQAIQLPRDAATLDRSDLRSANLLTLAAIAAILVGYYQTAWSIVSLWESSETFAHGFLIFPISAYLIWSQRKRLTTIRRRPDPMGLLVLGLLGFGWLLAALASVQIFKQYFLIAMIPAAVWAILGSRMALVLAFPLSYLLLAVPFGQEFIPSLIDFTANFTVYSLQLTGIPVYREGNFFMVPSGNWSVVEACSGLRYLIASFTLGTLYAYLTYRMLKRRLVFIALSVILPIIANGIRAYMIVMIGHLSSMRYAVGVDHLIYGWLFFGFVMLLLFWIGSFWREHDSAKASPQPTDIPSSVDRSSLKGIALAAGACVIIALIWPAYATYLENSAALAQSVEINIPGIPGMWETSEKQVSDWKPSYAGASVQFLQSYEHAGRTVSVYIAYYRNQRQGSELINYENVLVPEKNKNWNNVKEDTHNVSSGGQRLSVRQNLLHSPSARLLAWRWYWLDGETTVNPYLAKIILARNKLIGRSDDGAEIIIATPYDSRPDEAAAVLRDFLEVMMPALTKGVDDAGGR
jgi:exosortase A